MNERIETTILRSLAYNEEYSRKVLPFIRSEYFTDYTEKVVFEEICKFIFKYNKLPNQEVLRVEVDGRSDLNENSYKEVTDYVDNLETSVLDFTWLNDITEKWCRDKAIYLALMESISIVDGNDEKKTKDAIPAILSDALAVSFDNHVGHDYLNDYEERYEFYHQTEEKIPFDLDFFNKITKGGLCNKSLNIALAGTGVGKSLFMCHVAASCLLQNKNVLYITMEMAEEKIAERIDANLLNVNIQEMTNMPKSMFANKIGKLAQKTQGQLIIKEYPTASAHSGHFKALLNELALKKSFRPDIIFIDYLNICASSRYRAGSNVNSYTTIKSIAEELRGLAVETKIPIVSATQTTRSGYGSSDVELTDTSESFGLPATADLMFALISTEELESLGQIMVKQLKNRYNDPTLNKRFVVGIDRAKMRLYDCEQSAQNDILDSGQDEEYTSQEKSSGPRKSFEGFKF
jgi:replicative DNA helicase